MNGNRDNIPDQDQPLAEKTTRRRLLGPIDETAEIWSHRERTLEVGGSVRIESEIGLRRCSVCSRTYSEDNDVRVCQPSQSPHRPHWCCTGCSASCAWCGGTVCTAHSFRRGEQVICNHHFARRLMNFLWERIIK
jgi:hypothetical protein